MVIFQRKIIVTCNFLNGVLIHAEENKWMDENRAKLRIRTVWQKHPGSLKNPECPLD